MSNEALLKFLKEDAEAFRAEQAELPPISGFDEKPEWWPSNEFSTVSCANFLIKVLIFEIQALRSELAQARKG